MEGRTLCGMTIQNEAGSQTSRFGWLGWSRMRRMIMEWQEWQSVLQRHRQHSKENLPLVLCVSASWERSSRRCPAPSRLVCNKMTPSSVLQTTSDHCGWTSNTRKARLKDHSPNGWKWNYARDSRTAVSHKCHSWMHSLHECRGSESPLDSVCDPHHGSDRLRYIFVMANHSSSGSPQKSCSRTRQETWSLGSRRNG